MRLRKPFDNSGGLQIQEYPDLLHERFVDLSSRPSSQETIN